MIEGIIAGIYWIFVIGVTIVGSLIAFAVATLIMGFWTLLIILGALYVTGYSCAFLAQDRKGCEVKCRRLDDDGTEEK